MILCICEGVSDRTVRTAIQEGCKTLPAIGQACGAGTDCRKCCNAIHQLLNQARGSRQTRHHKEPHD